MATAVVVDHRTGLNMGLYGRRFYKLTGSGNDFVFVDARAEPAGRLEDPKVVGQLCARGTGIGADGVVFVEPPRTAEERFSIRYLNRDGSLALLCGNASLCSVRLAAELEMRDRVVLDIVGRTLEKVADALPDWTNEFRDQYGALPILQTLPGGIEKQLRRLRRALEKPVKRPRH